MTKTHDYDEGDPRAFLSLIELAWLAANPSTPLCQHCPATAVAVPMGTTAFALDVTHETTCPVVREAEV